MIGSLVPMRALSPSAAMLWLLLANGPALAQPAINPWNMTGVPRFTVTTSTLREVGAVPISPNFTTSFIFDTPVVQREGFILEERERFRQATLSEDGLLLTVLPSGDLPPGRRLKLTIRFADGALPTSADLVLVVSPRAEPQVEVYRLPRPGDSLQREVEQAKAGLQQCLTELGRERAERGLPRGLMGMLALNQVNKEGVHARDIIKDSTLRPGETFQVAAAASYRANGGEEKAPVVRLAVDLQLWNLGTSPWTPMHAQLVGPGVRWDARVWPPEPLAPGTWSRVLVEVEVPGLVPPGPYILKLWDEKGTRTMTLSGVTFP